MRINFLYRLNIKNILCFFGIHKIQKGCYWYIHSRQDLCIKCGKTFWKLDIKGHNLILYQEQIQRETRKVLIEKFKEPDWEIDYH